jgi:hypothetical protein
MTHAYVPVTIAAGLPGTLTKTRLREALRANPDGVTFRVESIFHGEGDLITGHHALNRDWELEVHDIAGRSVATVVFDGNGQAPAHLQAVVR